MASTMSPLETAHHTNEDKPETSQREASTVSTVSDNQLRDEEQFCSSHASIAHQNDQSAVTSHPIKMPSTLPVTPQKAPDTSIADQTPRPRSSKYRGVCWNKKNKRWQAAINNSGKYIYLGSYVSDIEAAKAFDLAALQIRGKNTKLNFQVDEYPESEWKGGAPPHLVEKYTGGTSRPKTTPFRQIHGAAPMRKLLPGNYATVQFPIKRRFEEAYLGKPSFDRASNTFLTTSSFSNQAPSTPSNLPKIKQEYPLPTSQIRRMDSLSTPFEKNQFLVVPMGMSSADCQLPGNSNIATKQLNTGGRESEITTGDKTSRMDIDEKPLADSSKGLAGIRSGSISIKPDPNAAPTNRMPVPLIPQLQDDLTHQVPSVISESVVGGEIEEAKVIVGSSRNQFGLIHRTVNNFKWNALVWDGTTMHNMGVYASEDDAQVACSSAVRLVESIMTRCG